MPSSRRTRERQLAKLAQRRRKERQKKQRQRLLALTVGLLVAFGGLGVAAWAFIFNNPKPKPAASATPTPTASSTPTANASPGSNCGYTAQEQTTGSKGQIPVPTFTIDVETTYQATVKTSMGTFTIRFLPKDAPCTVNSFVYLAKQGFYDGLTFHRIVKDFVIQGGDPAGTGQGGPGYTYNDELANSLKYEIGTVAMANSGANTNGSQWFVVTGAQGVSLPKSYTIFGTVTKGLDVVMAIQAVPTKGGTGTDADTPVTPVTIEKVTIKQS